MYKKLIAILRNNDYTTGNLLDYFYHQKYYKVIGIDLSRQTNASILQRMKKNRMKENFVRKLEERYGATMFFIAEKEQKAILNFYLDSLVVTE